MGITIHFEGTLKDEVAYEKLIAAAGNFADQEGWPSSPILEEEVSLERVTGDKTETYLGPTKGVCLEPHENAEPLRLEFDKDLKIQEYIKTQFAPIETHQKVVEFLKLLAPLFAELTVTDEGEYFESGDVARLETLREGCFNLLDEMLSKSDKYEGPIRLETGRIVDVLAKD